MSTLTVDAGSIRAVLDAYSPCGELTVDKGRLVYRLPKLGVAIALDRLSAGATVSTEKLSVAVQGLDMVQGEIVAKFSISGNQ